MIIHVLVDLPRDDSLGHRLVQINITLAFFFLPDVVEEFMWISLTCNDLSSIPF